MGAEAGTDPIGPLRSGIRGPQADGGVEDVQWIGSAQRGPQHPDPGPGLGERIGDIVRERGHQALGLGNPGGQRIDLDKRQIAEPHRERLIAIRVGHDFGLSSAEPADSPDGPSDFCLASLSDAIFDFS